MAASRFEIERRAKCHELIQAFVEVQFSRILGIQPSVGLETERASKLVPEEKFHDDEWKVTIENKRRAVDFCMGNIQLHSTTCTNRDIVQAELNEIAQTFEVQQQSFKAASFSMACEAFLRNTDSNAKDISDRVDTRYRILQCLILLARNPFTLADRDVLYLRRRNEERRSAAHTRKSRLQRNDFQALHEARQLQSRLYDQYVVDVEAEWSDSDGASTGSSSLEIACYKCGDRCACEKVSSGERTADTLKQQPLCLAKTTENSNVSTGILTKTQRRDRVAQQISISWSRDVILSTIEQVTNQLRTVSTNSKIRFTLPSPYALLDLSEGTTATRQLTCGTVVFPSNYLLPTAAAYSTLLSTSNNPNGREVGDAAHSTNSIPGIASRVIVSEAWVMQYVFAAIGGFAADPVFYIKPTSQQSISSSTLGVMRNIVVPHISPSALLHTLEQFVPGASSVLFLSRAIDCLRSPNVSLCTLEKRTTALFASSPGLRRNSTTSYARAYDAVEACRSAQRVFQLFIPTSWSSHTVQSEMSQNYATLRSDALYHVLNAACRSQWGMCVDGFIHAIDIILHQWRSQLNIMQMSHLNIQMAEWGMNVNKTNVIPSVVMSTSRIGPFLRRDQSPRSSCEAKTTSRKDDIDCDLRPRTLLWLRLAVMEQLKFFESLASLVNCVLTRTMGCLCDHVCHDQFCGGTMETALNISSQKCIELTGHLISSLLGKLECSEVQDDVFSQKMWRFLLSYALYPLLQQADRLLTSGTLPFFSDGFVGSPPFSSIKSKSWVRTGTPVASTDQNAGATRSSNVGALWDMLSQCLSNARRAGAAVATANAVDFAENHLAPGEPLWFDNTELTETPKGYSLQCEVNRYSSEPLNYETRASLDLETVNIDIKSELSRLRVADLLISTSFSRTNVKNEEVASTRRSGLNAHGILITDCLQQLYAYVCGWDSMEDIMDTKPGNSHGESNESRRTVWWTSPDTGNTYTLQRDETAVHGNTSSAYCDPSFRFGSLIRTRRLDGKRSFDRLICPLTTQLRQMIAVPMKTIREVGDELLLRKTEERTLVLELILALRSVALLDPSLNLDRMLKLLFSRLESPLAHVDPLLINRLFQEMVGNFPPEYSPAHRVSSPQKLQRIRQNCSSPIAPTRIEKRISESSTGGKCNEYRNAALSVDARCSKEAPVLDRCIQHNCEEDTTLQSPRGISKSSTAGSLHAKVSGAVHSILKYSPDGGSKHRSTTFTGTQETLIARQAAASEGRRSLLFSVTRITAALKCIGFSVNELNPLLDPCQPDSDSNKRQRLAFASLQLECRGLPTLARYVINPSVLQVYSAVHAYILELRRSTLVMERLKEVTKNFGLNLELSGRSARDIKSRVSFGLSDFRTRGMISARTTRHGANAISEAEHLLSSFFFAVARVRLELEHILRVLHMHCQSCIELVQRPVLQDLLVCTHLQELVAVHALHAYLLLAVLIVPLSEACAARAAADAAHEMMHLHFKRREFPTHRSSLRQKWTFVQSRLCFDLNVASGSHLLTIMRAPLHLLRILLKTNKLLIHHRCDDSSKRDVRAITGKWNCECLDSDVVQNLRRAISSTEALHFNVRRAALAIVSLICGAVDSSPEDEKLLSYTDPHGCVNVAARSVGTGRDQHELRRVEQTVPVVSPEVKMFLGHLKECLDFNGFYSTLYSCRKVDGTTETATSCANIGLD